METAPKQDKKPEIEAKRPLKSYVIEGAIDFVIVAAICVCCGLMDVYSRGISFEFESGRVLADSFGVGGLLCLGFWCLLWASSQGAFDIIVYGVRKVLYVTFHRHPEDSTLPSTYADYVAERRSKPRNYFYPFLIVSSAFFLVGLALSLCYM